jgi:hypothetical protein
VRAISDRFKAGRVNNREFLMHLSDELIAANQLLTHSGGQNERLGAKATLEALVLMITERLKRG